MPEGNDAGRRWIVAPPGPGQVSFHMAVGEGVELSAEQEAALTELMQALESSDAEVSGHAVAGKCSAYSSCTEKSCSPVRCATFVCHGLKAELTTGTTSWNLMGTFGVGTV
jgi:hypothetical protein